MKRWRWEVCVTGPAVSCVRLVGQGRGAGGGLVHGFSPLNLQLRVSLGLSEERKGIALPYLFEMGQH